MVYLVDSAIQRFNNQGQINPYPVDSAIGFPNTYPLDSDLSSGQCYPAFEQLGPVLTGQFYQPFEQLGPGVDQALSVRVQ